MKHPKKLGTCLHERFEQQVKRAPDTVALVWEDKSLSYAELNRRANWLAHRLRELGVTPGQLVGLHTERGIEMVVGIIGILKAGGAYLPLDPVYPKDRIAFMLEDSGVQMVVTQESLIENLEGTRGTQVLLDDLFSGPDNNPVPVATIDDLAYAMYTSGSTGKPKGVLITHHNVTRLFDATEGWYHFDEHDVWTLFHSYAFDFSVWELWGALLYGGRLIVVPYLISRSPEEFRELLAREGVTVLNQTPSAFRQLIQTELAQPKADLVLRYVIFGGEALELQSLRPWFERYGDEWPLLVNMYGITETTVHVTYRPIRLADLHSVQGSVIGVPIPDLQLHILDPEGEPAPTGVPGEMYVGGAGVARGYLNRADLTAQRFIADPFVPDSEARLYRTGDLARRLESGDIEYLGRIDHQVKIRGFRIELGEIEAGIAAHPVIREVVVIAREDVPGDKRLVAYVVTENEPIDLVDQLRELLRVNLPEYMIPAYFVPLDALPLTENGKVDRKALLAPDRVTQESTYVAPRTPIEETLAAIWAKILGFKRVGIHENFFELGGNSLLVISVIQQMRQAGLHADVSSLFLAPTIAEVAAVVASDSLEIEVPPNLIPPDCKAISPDMLPLVQLSHEEIENVVADVPGGAANIQDIYPLAPLQEGMLFHHRMASEGDPYIVTTVFGAERREPLDRYLVALQLVINRHDILRTIFLWESLSEPVQVVCRQAALIVEETELDPADGDIAKQLQERFDPRHYRLDVRQAPIIRIFIAYDAANARWVMLRIHHHLMEDHTTDELMSEEIYECLQGRADQLPTALPFRNFVAQARLGIPVEKHKDFFRSMLADVDEPTAPFGLTNVLGNGPSIEEARYLVDPLLASRLRETALKYRVSAASLFHLAWALVVSQCSGRDDVVFGTVLFGRMHAGHAAEQVMGPFINTLPLRLQLGDASVQDIIQQTHTRMALLLGHEHASLAVAQGCSGVAANASLFSALINFRHLKIQGEIPENSNHAMAVAISRMGLELLKFKERTNYPLELSVDDLGEGFMLEAQAQSPIEPQRICTYMHTALEQIVVALETSPTSTLRSLNVLPDAERRQLLVEWNDTARDYGNQARLHRLIEMQAAQTPDSIALEIDGQELTYAELNHRSNQLARLLRQKGVGPDVLVGVFAERSFEMVLALLAVLKAGGAYVPLDPSYPTERLAHMLEDAQTSLVLTQAHLANHLPAAVKEVHLIDASWDAYGDESGDDLDDVGTPENLAYVIFTSGSTGRPKGAMNEHRGICNRLLWMQEQYGLCADDRILQKTPFSFDVSVWEFFWPLIAGARLVIARPEGHRDSAYLVELIRESGITTLHFVPSMLRVFLEADGLEACTSLRRVICSGEALPHELQERFFAKLPEAELHNLYGPTEAAVDVTYWACQRGDERLTVPIGRPVANTQIYVLDVQMNPVPVGVAGELYIGGIQVGRGYVRRDDLTVERFVPDPFSPILGARLYKTGDLARYLPNGVVEYMGRSDFQVKIRGQRIELGEIEATLDQHVGVAQSVVMMREDNPGDQRLVAYVVPRQADISIVELKDHLSTQLPSYMVPSAFVLLDELPLTSSGKVDRKGLPAPEHSNIQQADYVAPRTPTEKTLAEIWMNVLSLERVGIDDNFFELGGHSLLALSVIERMRRAGLHADVRTLFVTPTIAALASAVGSDSEVVNVPPNKIPPGCAAITPDMLTLVQLSPEEIAHVANAVPGGAANIQDIYPLAPLQEGFLFHHLLTSEGEGDLYIMETQFRFDSRDRLDRYLEALQWVVNRNDIMRTIFLWEGLPEPAQVVCRQAPLIVEEFNLDAADGDIAQQLSARINLLNYRIDLSRPPMLRIFIAYDASNARWVMLQLFHHLSIDHTTLEVMQDEIQAYLQGRADQLPASQPFRNYVAQTRLGVSSKEHEAFFRHMLADVDEPTAPYGLTDVLGNGSSIEEARSLLDPALARRLRETAQKVGVSTASLFHLAWAQVLARISGRDDVVFGTVLFGRMQSGEGADRILGPCINTVPVRIGISEKGVQSSLRHTHMLLAQLLRHEHAPLALAQRCSAVAERTPLFSALLNYRYSDAMEQASVEADHAKTGIKLLGWEERTNYPLFMSVDDQGEGFSLDAQAQSPIDPQRICVYMQTALEQFVSALETTPSIPLRSLNVLPDAERRQLLVEWNDTKEDYSTNLLMYQSFEAQAARTPDRTAVKAGASSLSYRELDAHANQLAEELRARGVARGQRVGLCVDRGVEMLAAVLGILKTGAAYVPLDPMLPQERLRFMAEDAQLALLVSTSALTAVFGLPRERQLLLDIDAAVLASQPNQGLIPNAALDAQPEDSAYVIYTSGSTGQPKGVVVPHRAVVNFLTSMVHAPGLTADDVLVAVTTLSFDIAVLELQLPLMVGATIVIASRDEAVDGHALRGLLEEHHATIMQATPVTWRMILEAGWNQGKSIKALVGGEALPRDLADQLIALGVELWNMYGPTETTVWSTCARITDTTSGITIGRPIANTAIYILDEHMNLCPVGVAGELCIGGDGVTLGYWNRPELTADRFVEYPFSTSSRTKLYRTGDLARWRNDGTLEHLGRLDFQVKLRGYRIELGEIEAGIAKHPAVRDAVVVVRADVTGDARLVAYLVSENPPADLFEQLRALIRITMPDYMVPAHFVILERLPLTPNAKIDRKALLALEGVDRHFSNEFSGPRNDLEGGLVAAWEKVLGIQGIGINDNFFELGGNSLSVIKLVYEMEQQIGIKISLVEVFESPTVALLSASVYSHGKPKLSTVVPLQSEGDGIPVFCLIGLEIYREFARSLGPTQPVYGVYVAEEEAIVNQASAGEKLDLSIDRLAEAYYNAILKYRPAGPYRLAGLSFGGVLAVEVASRLRKSGAVVDLVFILDTILPWSTRKHWGRFILAQLAAITSGDALNRTSLLFGKLGHKYRGYYSKSKSKDQMNDMHEVHETLQITFVSAMKNWGSGQLLADFKVVLFQALDRSEWGSHITIDDDYGWRRLLHGSFYIERVDGNHLSLIQPPHVQELGKKAMMYMTNRNKETSSSDGSI